MISKTNPDRSKIIIEHEDHIKFWSRHFGVTKDELTARNRKGRQLCRCGSQTIGRAEAAV